jgi:hypothetical protein
MLFSNLSEYNIAQSEPMLYQRELIGKKRKLPKKTVGNPFLFKDLITQRGVS